MKRAVKVLLRPFVRPLLRRIDALRRRVDEVADRMDRHLPVIENEIESQNALLRSSTRDAIQLRAELERLRDDLVKAQRQIDILREDFDLAAPASAPMSAMTAEPETTSRSVRRLEEHSGELHLAFAYGPQSLPDHVVVDLEEAPAGDLVAYLRQLPFPERSAAEIRLSHALERFSLAQLRSAALPYWRSRLRPAGELVAVSVDAGAHIAEYEAGKLTFEQMVALTFGANEDLAVAHRSMLSRDLLEQLLAEAGFESIVTAARWRGEDGVSHIEVKAKRGHHGHVPIDAASPAGVSASRA